MRLENLKSIKDSSQLNAMYWTTGDIYNSPGDHPASIKYYKPALSTNVWHFVTTYTLLRRVVDTEIRTGNAGAGSTSSNHFKGQRKS